MGPEGESQPMIAAAILRIGGRPAASSQEGYRFVLYTMLVLGAMNVVLRPSPESPLTPFYLLAPLVFLPAILFSSAGFRWALIGLGVACYGMIVGLLYGLPFSFMSTQIIHYLYIFLLFGVLDYLASSDPKFLRRMTFLLKFLLGVIVTAILVQAATGVEMPNVQPLYEGRFYNAFFFTPNDLALFLGALYCLFLTSRYSTAAKIAGTVLLFVILIVNSNRAVLLAVTVMAASYGVIKLSNFLRTPPIFLFLVGLLLMSISIGVVTQLEITVHGVVLNLGDLMYDPVRRVLELDPYRAPGSVFERTDALIFSLTEYFKTGGLGLGPGGSRYVLTLPQYSTVNVATMHNAIGELWVELGPLLVLSLAVAAARVLMSMGKVRPERGDAVRMVLLTALPLLSLSQSGGYISNYSFWIVFYLIVRAKQWHESAAQTRLLCSR